MIVLFIAVGIFVFFCIFIWSPALEKAEKDRKREKIQSLYTTIIKAIEDEERDLIDVEVTDAEVTNEKPKLPYHESSIKKISGKVRVEYKI